MVAATTSYPRSTSSAAATELSTPPDMATRTRSLTAPPRPNAERGTRNAKHGARSSSCVAGSYERTTSGRSAFRVPRSALHSPVQHRRERPHLLDNPGEHRDQRLHVF